MNSLLLKNWKLVLIVIGFVLIVSAWQYDHAVQYKRGRDSIGKAKQDRELSAAYQTGKAVREEKERVRYVQVPKIIEKTVYRNTCLDSDGLSVINAAITDGN